MDAVTNASNGSRRQAGFVISSELTLISSVLVGGMITGLATMRDAVTAEMEDVAEAIGQLDQSFAIHGLRTAHGSARVEGSSFGDSVDRAAGDGQVFSYVSNDGREGAPGIPPSSTSFGR